MILLPKKLYKNYKKCTQKLYKTLNLYIFYIQKLYKSKFCLIINVQKMYIKLKVQTKNMQTENNMKLEMYVFCTYK